jgi:hypothetical protein
VSIEIFKLHCTSAGHPYVQSGALPVGYFDEFFNGQALPESWSPPLVEVRRTRSKLSDIVAWKESLPLLSERAVDLFRAVAPHCAEYRQFMSIRGHPFYVVNVLAQEDIVDIDRSELTRMGEGRMRSIRSYAFKTSHVSNQVFKLPGFFDGPVFVTRRVAQAVVEAGLNGFQFRDPAVSETAQLFAGKDVNAFPGVKR